MKGSNSSQAQWKMLSFLNTVWREVLTDGNGHPYPHFSTWAEWLEHLHREGEIWSPGLLSLGSETHISPSLIFFWLEKSQLKFPKTAEKVKLSSLLPRSLNKIGGVVTRDCLISPHKPENAGATTLGYLTLCAPPVPLDSESILRSSTQKLSRALPKGLRALEPRRCCFVTWENFLSVFFFNYFIYSGFTCSLSYSLKQHVNYFLLRINFW